MPRATFDLPQSILDALGEAASTGGRSADALVRDALSRSLDRPIHTVFQVSTTGALVAGVFDREVDVATILAHGDFGLGTFEKLDGEMVVLDGRAYRASGSGAVREAAADDGAPFAVVTRFKPDRETKLGPVRSFAALAERCDAERGSENLFYALRLDGCFDRVRTRAVGAMAPGSTLVDAAKAQHESTFEDVEGTLVGLWSPAFSSAFSVAGYHFHFISDDRTRGGHLLDVAAADLRLQVETLDEFRLVLPETASFVKADLSVNPAEALARAEQAN